MKRQTRPFRTLVNKQTKNGDVSGKYLRAIGLRKKIVTRAATERGGEREGRERERWKRKKR